MTRGAMVLPVVTRGMKTLPRYEGFRFHNFEAAVYDGHGIASQLLSGYEAPVTERWPHLDVRESRFTQHLRYLLPGILFALCPSEHDHAERRDGEWSRLLIVIEHLMNENVASRPQTLEALPSKEATFLRCPVMIDH